MAFPSHFGSPVDRDSELTGYARIVLACLSGDELEAAEATLERVAASERSSATYLRLRSEVLWRRRNLDALREWVQGIDDADLSDPNVLGAAKLARARLGWAASGFKEVLDWLDPFLESDAMGEMDRGLVARLHHVAGICWHRLMEFDLANARLGRAMAIFDTIPDLEGVADSMQSLALVARSSYRWRQSAALLTQALRIYGDLGLAHYVILTSNNLGMLHLFRGQFEHARPLISRATRLAEESNQSRYLGVTLNCQGLMLLRTLNFRAARTTFSRALAVHAKAQSLRGRAQACEYLGELSLAQGRYRPARLWLKRAYDLVYTVPAKDVMYQARCRLAEVELRSGNLDAALGYAEEALTAFTKMNDLYEIAVARRVRAEILIALGRTPEAREELDLALGFFHEVGERWESIKAQTLVDLMDGKMEAGDLRTWDVYQQELTRIHGLPGADVESNAVGSESAEIPSDIEGADDEIGADTATGADSSFATPDRSSGASSHEPSRSEPVDPGASRGISPPRSRRTWPPRAVSRIDLLLPAPEDGVHADFPGLLGRSQVLLRALDQARRAAALDAPILIRGETGTGKELIARAIHLQSSQRSGPFVPVNCGANTQEMIDAELFGHTRGAFTGATERREGLIRTAQGGTLFLDEVGELPLHLQARLLRVLDTGEVRSVGSDRVERAEFRVVSATHQDIEARARRGQFRGDLFHRLAGITITLPPLREREGDVELLIRHFEQRALEDVERRGAEKEGDHSGRGPGPISAREMAKLREYTWPGNVRELRNVVNQLVAGAGIADLGRWATGPHPVRIADGIVGTPGSGTYEYVRGVGLVDRVLFLSVLRETQGNVSEVARRFGISRQHVYRLCESFGADPGGYREG